MQTSIQAPGGVAVVERLQAAINAHDLDALASCFTAGFVSTQPAHPARNFTGREHVRQNWTMILAGVPDLKADLLSSAVTGDSVWAEWRWSGTRRDGQPHEMRGVTVQKVTGGLISQVNFYMEVVDSGGADVVSAIRQVTAPGAPA